MESPALHPTLQPVLGIETSCDETAAAVLAADGRVLAEAVLSQTEHARFGGVVPEIAARAHLQHLPGLVGDVLAQAGVTPSGLGGVAASTGPGLIGGLIVGSGFGKGLALAAGLPFVAVNHLEAHALTARLTDGLAFPYLLLLVSGGHCQCVAVRGVGQYRRLGGTIDDAVGEAFDKVGKLLGQPWPGGPHVERLAALGDCCRWPLPRPLLRRAGCDFSFSGLKTAVAQVVAKYPPGPMPQRDAADIAASFQAAVADVMADRATHALGMMPDAAALVVAGGVAANGAVRAALAGVAQTAGLPMVAPPLRLCGDNAVMVAWTGIERLRLGLAEPDRTRRRGRAGRCRRWRVLRELPPCLPRRQLRRLHEARAAGVAAAARYLRKPARVRGAGHPCRRRAATTWRRRRLNAPANGAQGIGRLLDHPPPALAPITSRRVEAGGAVSRLARADPIAAAGRRTGCCVANCTRSDVAALKRECLAHDPQVAVHARDGWAALTALLPPAASGGGWC